MADQKSFLRDVRAHKMTIEIDQGVHRCIHFGTTGSSAHHFRLVTWPGHLSISGDVGDSTFSRLRDMFEFFRHAGPGYAKEDRINIGYWDEKLRSVDKHGVRKVFSETRYVEAIRNDMAEYLAQFPLSKAKEIVEHARLFDLFEVGDNYEDTIGRVIRWACPITRKNPFNDFYEHRLHEPSFHLVWCMRAIQWGIKRYDLHKQGRTQADHDRRVLSGLE